MPIDFTQLKNDANAKIAENQKREQNKQAAINKLNDYLDLKIAELLASEDKEAITLLNRVLGNENDCLSDVLQNALIEHNEFMKNTSKLMFCLEMYFPAMQIFSNNNVYYLRLTQSTRNVWTLMVDIDNRNTRVAESNKKIDIEPVVFNPTGIDLNFKEYLPGLIKTKGKCKTTDFISFEVSKQFDIDKYTDIICDAFSELGFRSVKITHTNPEWIYDNTHIEFFIEVTNPLFEEE